MIAKPLKLPEATILFGPPGHGQQELANAIASLDNGLEFVDLNTPFYSATRAMFFEFDRVDAGVEVLLDTELPIQLMTKQNAITVVDWMATLKQELVSQMGRNAPAELALTNLAFNPIPQPRILFLNVTVPEEAKSLIAHFNGDALVLKCGPMNGMTFSCPTLHMVGADAGERMRELRHELGDLF